MIEYAVDPETLRDAPRDAAAAAAELDAMLAAPLPQTPQTPLEAMARHTAIGNAARSLQRLELAEHHQRRALELAGEHGTPRQAVLARVRYAHVLQWQGRFGEAWAELDACLTPGALADAGDAAHFVHQHAGKCAYDEGRWALAREHFEAALRRRRAGGDRELVASSELALDAAGACLAAVAIAAELHRLVPAAHAAARPHAAPLLAPARPHVGFLVELRTPLLHGPVPLRAVRAIHRYQPGTAAALTELAGGGWLTLDAGASTVVATARCRQLLSSAMAVLDHTCEELWGDPADPAEPAATAPNAEKALATANALVAAARGTSAGDAFDALASAGHPTAGGSVGGRLFSALNALRQHRADAHAAAWAAEGLTAGEVRALAADHPQRRRIEARTDLVAARAYRPLPEPDRAEFVAALRALQGIRPPRR